jgi:hypothetical protein
LPLFTENLRAEVFSETQTIFGHKRAGAVRRWLLQARESSA